MPKVVAVAYGSGRLRELFIKEFEWHFKRGSTKVVVTRAGRLREWLQGERRLYLISDNFIDFKVLTFFLQKKITKLESHIFVRKKLVTDKFPNFSFSWNIIPRNVLQN